MSAISACRSCGASGLTPILSLGETPLANSLLTEEQLIRPEPRYPLDLVRCGACSLVQITETVPPETLFRDYVYFSSFSDTMLRHARESAETLVRERDLGPDSLVVEVASNDGYLLQNFVRAGVPCWASSRPATSRPWPKSEACGRSPSSSGGTWRGVWRPRAQWPT